MGRSLNQKPRSTEWSYSYRMSTRRPRLRARDRKLKERAKASHGLPDWPSGQGSWPFVGHQGHKHPGLGKFELGVQCVHFISQK